MPPLPDSSSASFSLAGIGGVNPVTAMFVNLFVGLSIGANVVVAMHVGAGEFHSIKKSVHTAMALSLIGRVALGRPGSPWPPGCWTPSACPKTPSPTRSPMCGFTSAPFRSSPSTTSGRATAGHGDAKRPLYALAAAVVVNFVLDLAFVRLFGWGTAGIGIATVIAAA